MRRSKCVFCKKSFQKKAFLNSENFFAVFDSYPVNRGHTLIIPYEHIENLWQVGEDKGNELLSFIKKVKSYLDKKFSPDGYNLGINNGSVAGQTIFHLHIHLIPRYAGDQKDPRGGVRKIFPKKAKYWKD